MELIYQIEKQRQQESELHKAYPSQMVGQPRLRPEIYSHDLYDTIDEEKAPFISPVIARHQVSGSTVAGTSAITSRSNAGIVHQ